MCCSLFLLVYGLRVFSSRNNASGWIYIGRLTNLGNASSCFLKKSPIINDLYLVAFRIRYYDDVCVNVYLLVAVLFLFRTISSISHTFMLDTDITGHLFRLE